jgi:hypothetical protein
MRKCWQKANLGETGSAGVERAVDLAHLLVRRCNAGRLVGLPVWPDTGVGPTVPSGAGACRVQRCSSACAGSCPHPGDFETRVGGCGRTTRGFVILREDVRASCPQDVWHALSAVTRGDAVRVWVAEDDFHVDGTTVFVPSSLVDSAKAYVEVAGGEDAVHDQVVVLISQATAVDSTTRDVGEDARAVDSESGRPLPVDQRLPLIKLTPDAVALSSTDLKERTRQAWRLSIDRLKSEPPVGVAAVVQQRVRGAWRFEDVVQSREHLGRVEFILGDDLPELDRLRIPGRRTKPALPS